jgi:adenylyl-sulfate kinase
MPEQGFTVWFTGVTGSGKSTLAALLQEDLAGRGYSCEVLDSGRIRQELNRSLGFSRQEIETNLKRIAYECKLLNRNGVIGVVAAVSPYRDTRDAIREDLDRFIEVYCRCPMEVLLRRDQKDLFGRAQRGEVRHVAGLNAPYEEPIRPEVLLNTDTETPDASVGNIVTTLRLLRYLPETPPTGYTAEQEEIIKRRLEDLGYI